MAAKKRKARRNGCKACEVRARAGFDGLCPACAAERTRTELAREREARQGSTAR